jgi:hypothetical protein
MPLCTHLQRGRTSRYKPTQVYTSWCLRITGFHWRWAATSASRVGMRAGSRRPGLYVRMYPCARGENYFVTRTIVTCELLAGCWMLPPLSRCPFGKYCVAGCPSTCGIYGRSCGLVQPSPFGMARVQTPLSLPHCPACPVRSIEHKFLGACVEGSYVAGVEYCGCYSSRERFGSASSPPRLL